MYKAALVLFLTVFPHILFSAGPPTKGSIETLRATDKLGHDDFEIRDQAHRFLADTKDFDPFAVARVFFTDQDLERRTRARLLLTQRFKANSPGNVPVPNEVLVCGLAQKIDAQVKSATNLLRASDSLLQAFGRKAGLAPELKRMQDDLIAGKTFDPGTLEEIFPDAEDFTIHDDQDALSTHVVTLRWQDQDLYLAWSREKDGKYSMSLYARNDRAPVNGPGFLPDSFKAVDMAGKEQIRPNRYRPMDGSLTKISLEDRRRTFTVLGSLPQPDGDSSKNLDAAYLLGELRALVAPRAADLAAFWRDAPDLLQRASLVCPGILKPDGSLVRR